jgi:hypothetical protein
MDTLWSSSRVNRVAARDADGTGGNDAVSLEHLTEIG